ncbi:peptidoglycan recognition protein-like [Argiope bruennichi]|uniref:peptidoglycan recognition protein-like n=1 Tax=Argiope bruennichi TaxID=94029 RepID=UPI0024943ACA|nr:peptidoglycan recognition protein-like [Argiope bruennichi]
MRKTRLCIGNIAKALEAASTTILLQVAQKVQVGAVKEQCSARCSLFRQYVTDREEEESCDGIQFVTREEWKARPPVRTTAMALPVGHVIIIHTCFGACDNTPYCKRNVRTIQDYHMDDKGWWDIAYNFLIGGDGRVYVGVGFHNVGEHTINYNDISIGVAFLGNFDNMMPTVQMLNVTKGLINCGIKKGYLTPSVEIHGHKDATCTNSPGKNLYAKIKQWDNFIGGRLPMYHCCTDQERMIPSDGKQRLSG